MTKPHKKAQVWDKKGKFIYWVLRWTCSKLKQKTTKKKTPELIVKPLTLRMH